MATTTNAAWQVFYGSTFKTEPKTYFYNWLYINTLHLYDELTEQLMDYNAFTDIAFNPQKSINCQAEAAAIYVSLQKQGLLQEALKNNNTFLDIVYPAYNEINLYQLHRINVSIAASALSPSPVFPLFAKPLWMTHCGFYDYYTKT